MAELSDDFAKAYHEMGFDPQFPLRLPLPGAGSSADIAPATGIAAELEFQTSLDNKRTKNRLAQRKHRSGTMHLGYMFMQLTIEGTWQNFDNDNKTDSKPTMPRVHRHRTHYRQGKVKPPTKEKTALPTTDMDMELPGNKTQASRHKVRLIRTMPSFPFNFQRAFPRWRALPRRTQTPRRSTLSSPAPKSFSSRPVSRRPTSRMPPDTGAFQEACQGTSSGWATWIWKWRRKRHASGCGSRSPTFTLTMSHIMMHRLHHVWRGKMILNRSLQEMRASRAA